MRGPFELLPDLPGEAPEEALTVGQVLGVAPGPVAASSVREPTLQEKIAACLVAVPQRIEHPARILFATTDAPALVSSWALVFANRVVGNSPVWLRFYRKDGSNGLLAVIHGPVLPGEADLILAAERPGMLTRSVLRAIAGWAFGTCGLARIVLRIPAGDRRLSDYARRAGCRHEGMARDFYGPGADASVWSMLARECRWLDQAPAAPLSDPLPTPRELH